MQKAFKTKGISQQATDKINTLIKNRLGGIFYVAELHQQKEEAFLSSREQGDGVFTFCTSGIGTPCKRCAALEGKTGTLVELANAGAVPPLHPNCRCWLETVGERVAEAPPEVETPVMPEIPRPPRPLSLTEAHAKYFQSLLSENKEPVQAEIRAMTPTMIDAQEQRDREWQESRFSSRNEIDNAILFSRMSKSQMEELPESVFYILHQIYLSELEKAEESVRAGTGNPNIDVFARSFLQALTLNLINFTDDYLQKQVELLKNAYRVASLLGDVAGWATPGGLGSTATNLLGKAAKPITEPVSNFFANRIGGAAGNIIGGAASRAIAGGVAGYGRGFVTGGVESWAGGDPFLEGFNYANRSGLESAKSAAVAGALVGGFEGWWRHGPWGTSQTLVDTATTPGRGGVTPVGRAFQKHAGNSNRAGAFAGEVAGNATKNTEQGAKYLNAILNNPNSTYTVKNTKAFGDVLDVRLPDGTGARWSADGKTFIMFLEKYTPIR
jgi:hypothetical protein